jgi:hypothetical protein
MTDGGLLIIVNVMDRIYRYVRVRFILGILDSSLESSQSHI